MSQQLLRPQMSDNWIDDIVGLQLSEQLQARKKALAMDAPGATEAADSACQANSEQETPVPQSTNEISDERYRDDRPTPTEDGQDSNDDEEEIEEGEDEGEGEEDGSDEDEDDEEPRLKYAYLTKHLSSVYRNGDATSSFLTAGDKMVWPLGRFIDFLVY